MVHTHENQYIYAQDVRTCQFFHRYLKQQIHCKDATFNQPQAYGRFLNDQLNTFFLNQKTSVRNIDTFVLRMNKACQTYLLPTEDFSWLASNQRACYWFWGRLRLATKEQFEEAVPTVEMLLSSFGRDYALKTGEVYAPTGLDVYPTTHKQRFDLIVQFMDQWFFFISKITPVKPHVFMEQCKHLWASSYMANNPFRWLDKHNPKDCEWAWGYMVKQQNKIARKNWQGLPSVKYLAPLKALRGDTEELYLAIYAAHDLWNGFLGVFEYSGSSSPSVSLANFTMKMKKTWEQRKWRSKVKLQDLSSIQLQNLSEDAKRKLLHIASVRQCSIMNVLEDLVCQEYEQVKHLPS